MTTTDPEPRETTVAGRYRLVAPHGTAPHLQFWQGVDTRSGQPVAVTLIDPDGGLPADLVDAILARSSRLRGLDVVGIARIVDVVRTGAVGAVVCEWVRGGSLREVVDTSPAPIAAAAAIESLIVAADCAHSAGFVLGVDHPDRIRVSTDGDVVLAFPAPMPDTTPEDDLHGIGSTLYALLVDRWAPHDPMPDGWRAADLISAGWPVEPAEVDKRIPFLISSATAGLLRADGGIGSAGTVLGLLRQARAVTDVEPPVAVPAPPVPPIAGPAPRPRDPRLRMAVIGAVAAALVAIVAVPSVALVRTFGDGGSVGLDAARLGLAPTDAPSEPAVTRQAAAAPVRPAAATVFSPDGSPDNPGSAGLAVDGDRSTSWSTDRYYDDSPFPGFKQGVGLLLTMPRPATLSAVTLDVASSGTAVEIRTSGADPTALSDTTRLTGPVTLRPGPNRIPVTSTAPTSRVLVWITTLGSTDGASRAAIKEVETFTTAPA
ncbi:protein kinase family protein [Mycolicibacterium sediminis]|uniref:Peptidoglycan biosynthesis protein MviN n=1 Tax=Mycolicibacterium sediminis TaxID=1286180 RepID=A0A7I7QKL4_9MYCO|nr:protein kinase family protein [Mycolicibacterium sediminis]BBY26821.1 hypothetical protein MSEDJ_09170 [Mycolicibacterium sediminis]